MASEGGDECGMVMCWWQRNNKWKQHLVFSLLRFSFVLPPRNTFPPLSPRSQLSNFYFALTNSNGKHFISDTCPIQKVSNKLEIVLQNLTRNPFLFAPCCPYTVYGVNFTDRPFDLVHDAGNASVCCWNT